MYYIYLFRCAIADLFGCVSDKTKKVKNGTACSYSISVDFPWTCCDYQDYYLTISLQNLMAQR
jgi:hypothetical protein